MNLFRKKVKKNLIHLGYFCGLLSGLLWAIAGISYEKLYTDFPMFNAFALNIIILFIAEFVLLLLICSYLAKEKLLPHLNYISVIAVIGGLCGGPIGMLFYLQSLQSIGVSYTATISISYPIIASILSIKFLSVKTSKKTIFSFILIILLIIPIMYQDEKVDISYWGIFFALFCALCWAVEIVISSYVMRYYQSEQTYLFRQAGSSLGYFIIIIFQLVYGSYFVPLDFNVFNDINLWKLELIVILSSGFSYFFYYKAIGILNPIRAMALNITYSLWAVILSAVIFSKEISMILIAIGFVVLVNVFIVARGEKK